MKIEIDLPEIEGFEYIGEYRIPEEDEWFLYGNGSPEKVGLSPIVHIFPILRKVEPPREFKEGAWYPVELNVGKVITCRYAEDSFRVMHHFGSSLIVRDGIMKIGEEIKIDWGE